MNLIRKIKYNGEIVTLDQLKSESNERFDMKVQFVRKLEEKKYEWKDVKRLTNYWYNIKFNKCKYDKEVYDLIMSLDT